MCWGGTSTPEARLYLNKSQIKASKAPTGTLSSTLLPQSAPTTKTREQLNRHMTLKIKRQFHVGNKDMHTNQTQKSRGRRLQQGFGKCNAVQLVEFLSHLVLLPQPDSHQLLTVEAFMYWLSHPAAFFLKKKNHQTQQRGYSSLYKVNNQ